MTKTVALVSCAKGKQATAAAAKDLYTSTLFVKARAYAERNADAWFVLSAKHGLLDPDAIVEPYEQTLNEIGADGRREWASRVRGQMERRGLLRPGTRFLWLAGKKYQADLGRELTAFTQSDPLRGLQIGQRLAWLTRALK